jgi:hypothetical protein
LEPSKRDVYACMEAAGYTLKVSSKGYCKSWDRERVLLEECYVPTGRVARWIYNAEMWLTGGMIDDRPSPFDN